MEKNVITPLNFSKYINAFWIVNAQNFRTEKRTIVVNLGNYETIVQTPPPVKLLLPRTSAIYQDVTILRADSLMCVEVPKDIVNIGGVFLDDCWYHVSKHVPAYPEDVPLFKSSQFEVETVRFDPFYANGQTLDQNESNMADFKVKVNIWFCPANTNCGIHNCHITPEMMEVHTQVYGTGRVQKFRENDFRTMYEELIMNPGMTHAPLTGEQQDGDLFYGWHQYCSDTDCIWIANEFHPP